MDREKSVLYSRSGVYGTRQVFTPATKGVFRAGALINFNIFLLPAAVVEARRFCQLFL